MKRTMGRLSVLSACLALTITSIIMAVAHADSPVNEHFARTWQRTDKPVAELQTTRTWMWGPEAFTGELTEPYTDVAGGERKVQYFDKSRMEITSDPDVLPGSPWYVTNGLLVKELISGQMQVGDAEFISRHAAMINVAGDSDAGTGPTYATFRTLLDAPALPDGAQVTQRVARSGDVSSDPSMAQYGVFAAYRVSVEGIHHQIAAPFWEFLNSEGLVWIDERFDVAPLFPNAFYTTGYPITEAYWAAVMVNNESRDVLIQCFERRCLTYTPANAPEWQVEAGNVGRHYYAWRYNQRINEASPTASAQIPTATTEPAPIATAIATAVPTTPPPTHTAVPTDPPLSHAYLNPEGAVLSILREQCNCEASTGNPLVQRTLSHAFTLRHQFHLATASADSFNRDTTSFYEWLEEVLPGLTQSGLVWRPDFTPQVNAAVYHPTSPIGIQLRRLEAGTDPLFSQFGSGPEVYWTYLIEPAIRMQVNPFGYDMHRTKFDRLVADYHAALITDPDSTISFGNFLAAEGFSIL